MDAGDGRNIFFDEQHRDQLDQATDQHGHHCQHGEEHRLAFEHPVPGGFAGRDGSFFHRRGLRFGVRFKRARLRGLEEVVSHHERADDVERTADGAQLEHRNHLHNCFEEVRILQESVLGKLFPHQTFSDARDVNRDAVKHNAQHRNPEMIVRQFRGPEFGFVKAREQEIQHREREKTIPAQGAGVNVGDGPIRIMRE